MKSRNVINRLINKISLKEKDAVLNLIADDAVFFDPHYPQSLMKGKQQIAKGLDWSFRNIKEFRFEEINYMEVKKGNISAVEYHCSHLLPSGNRLDFNQVLIFEINNGLFSSLRAYLPYGPHGLTGFMLKISHILNKKLE